MYNETILNRIKLNQILFVLIFQYLKVQGPYRAMWFKMTNNSCHNWNKNIVLLQSSNMIDIDHFHVSSQLST